MSEGEPIILRQEVRQTAEALNMSVSSVDNVTEEVTQQGHSSRPAKEEKKLGPSPAQHDT